MFLAMATAAGADQVIERILAVVDGRPVLLSEARLMERLRGVEQAAAIEGLVEERLMFQEASRLAQAAVSGDEEERAYQSLIARLGGQRGAWPEAELRQVARRQTAIVKYIEFRFRPQVRVVEEEARQAYERDYGSRPDAPPFEQVAPRLRERLAEQDLSQRIEAWVKELRASADIRYNPPPPRSSAS